MNNYYNSIVKKDPSQRSNLKGWINRANRAHLAKQKVWKEEKYSPLLFIIF